MARDWVQLKDLMGRAARQAKPDAPVILEKIVQKVRFASPKAKTLMNSGVNRRGS